jgi:hypothetical protein
LRALAFSCLLANIVLAFTQAQQAPQKPAEKPSAKASTPTEPQNPAQIELLETRYRFEANGDSRKEVHARVHINSELGVRQFARLSFEYNRSFESVEIPLVRITHPSGGTADILPSAIIDQPNPAVLNAPAYHDVRVKSVRILGLTPGDNLEYRVITTVSHHPLAPDFWLDHSFDRTGVVSQEIFELDLPASRQVQIHINPVTPATSAEKSGEGASARTTYRWDKNKFHNPGQPIPSDAQDVVLTTYQDWGTLSDPIAKLLEPSPEAAKSVSAKAQEIVQSLRSDEEKLKALYNFVAHKITTVDLPLGSTGFRTRPPAEILASGYATAEDKFALLDGLANTLHMESRAALFGAIAKISGHPPTPALLVNSAILIHISSAPENLGHGLWEMCDHCGKDYWLVPSMEVVPFAALPSSVRGKQALIPHYMFTLAPFANAPTELPFPSTQLVHVDATLNADGKLGAKVHYSLRGDNELLLRVAFHQSPKDKWKELAQLLSLSDGFRGQVTSVNASDPYATREPFTVDYEITQPKFVDWSKKPVRIPAMLPQIGLPEAPAKPAAGAAASPIDLGTPLEVETRMTLNLPPGTTTTAPTGTSVQRDYATFSSQYSAKGPTVTASRHIHFLLRQVPADRAADYNAFLRAVRNDEAQDFTLDHPAPLPAKQSSPNFSKTLSSPERAKPGFSRQVCFDNNNYHGILPW